MQLLTQLRSAAEQAPWRWSAAGPSRISTGLFGDLSLPLAGLHGCERRDAQGELHVAPVRDRAVRPMCAQALERLVARHRGPLLEDKGAGLALHFLQARELEHELRAEVALLAAPLVPNFALLDGHAVIEVKPAAHTKDSAVSAFMQEEPFRGRLPIFIGDDQTDYGGFAAVRRFERLAIAVGPRVKSEWWLPGPAAVRQLVRAARGAAA
mgnify:CR=1 FL=1